MKGMPMANFAVIDNEKVVNVIVAESKAIAEEVTGFTCVEYTDSEAPHIGFGYVDGVFEQPVITEPIITEPTE
jgi:hypothetical protein